jgi:uncharacterized protein (DUF849 family)
MAVNSPVWLEVALNGAAGRAFQPGIPISPQEIIEQAIACIDEGATIVHLHAYDEAGLPTENAETYAKIITGIRQQRDAIIYPTLALSGTIEERLAPLRQLASQGLLEWSVVDPGSVNITHRSQLGPESEGLVYINPDSHIKAALALAHEQQWRPAYAIYEPGFARLGSALASQYEGLRSPVYRLMFSDNLLFGTPPTPAALEFYIQHLSECAPRAPWMVSGLDADIEPIIEQALDSGGHLRVGLEDAPFGSTASNVELVRQARAYIDASQRGLASVEEIRQAP